MLGTAVAEGIIRRRPAVTAFAARHDLDGRALAYRGGLGGGARALNAADLDTGAAYHRHADVFLAVIERETAALVSY